MKFIERMAEQYLEHRGRVVLPRLFCGMAIGGYATALKQEDGSYTVWLGHSNPLMIVLNYSTLVNVTPRKLSESSQSPVANTPEQSPKHTT